MEKLMSESAVENDFRRLSASQSGDRAAERAKARRQLEADTEAFLAKGGKIEVLGVRQGPPPPPDAPWFMIGRLEADPAKRQEGRRKRRGVAPEFAYRGTT